MQYLITYLYLAFALVTLALTIVLASTSARQPSKRSILIFMGLGAAWAFADFHSNLAETAEQLRDMSYLFAPVWALIPFFGLHAALVYVGKLNKVQHLPLGLALFLPAAACMWLEWSGRLHVEYQIAAVNGLYFQSVASGWQHAVTAYYAVYLLAAASLIFPVAVGAGRSGSRGPAKVILVGVALLALAGGLTNGGLNAVDIKLPFLGSLFACALMWLLAFWIMRRQLFTPETLLRKRAEDALFASELRYHALLDTSPDAITVVDLRGHLLLANQRALAQLGYESLEELQAEGKTAFDFIAPEEREQFKRVGLGMLETGESNRFEYQAVLRNGARLSVEVNVGLVRGRDGEPVGYIAVTRDLTERHQAEMQRLHLEAQVQHSQKLESLGVLAGGIAHDFNNLLGGVLGNASLARLDIPEGSPASARIDRVEQAAQRATELTRQMLAYSGRGKFVVEPVDLAELVRQMSQLLEVSISKKVELVFEADPNLSMVTADASQIQQVVMNLITNAAEAIGDESGSIHLHLRPAKLGPGERTDNATGEPIPAGDYVCLDVADTGCGLDLQATGRMFDPFFSTKFTGRGLGLAAVLGIVQGHKGGISVKSQAGEGTSIRVYLPTTETGAEFELPVVQPDTVASGHWKGAGTVLVVDDEEMIRNLVVPTLEAVGFEVICAADGRSGLDLFQSHFDQLSAVVLDLTMPKLDGKEAHRLMRKRSLDLPILMTSGYSEEEVSELLAGQNHTAFLQKPFKPDELISNLRACMDC